GEDSLLAELGGAGIVRSERAVPAALPPRAAAARPGGRLADRGRRRPLPARAPDQPGPARTSALKEAVMSYTPVELHHVRFRRTLFGYRPSAVERVLAELADRVEALEADVARHREVEDLLRTTLVSAERACQELREQASREAAAI